MTAVPQYQRPWDAWKGLDRKAKRIGRIFRRPVRASNPLARTRYEHCWFDLEDESKLPEAWRRGPITKATEREIFHGLLRDRVRDLQKKMEKKRGAGMISTMWCLFICARRLRKNDEKIPLPSVNDLVRHVADILESVMSDEARSASYTRGNQRKYPSDEKGREKYGDQAGQPIRTESSVSDWHSKEAHQASEKARENGPREIREELFTPANGGPPQLVHVQVYDAYQPKVADPSIKLRPLEVVASPLTSPEPDQLAAPSDGQPNILTDASADVILIQRLSEHLLASGSVVDQRSNSIVRALLDDPNRFDPTDKKYTYDVDYLVGLFDVEPHIIWNALRVIATHFQSDKQGQPSLLARRMGLTSLEKAREALTDPIARLSSGRERS